MTYQVYLVRHKISRKAYIGKTKNKIGINYWTSSSDKEFKNDFKTNPDNYRVVIIAEFDNPKDAIKLEIELHNYFDVGRNPKFYNRAKQTSVGFDMTGKILSEDTRQKMSKSRRGKGNGMFGKKHSKNTREKISEKAKLRLGDKNPFFGKTHSPETINKLRNRKHTEELKRHWSELKRGEGNPMFGKTHEKISCKYCGKLMSKNILNRWHNENCKLKNI